MRERGLQIHDSDKEVGDGGDLTGGRGLKVMDVEGQVWIWFVEYGIWVCGRGCVGL